MAIAAVSLPLEFDSSPSVTQCGSVYCSQAFVEFSIKCSKCLIQFNLRSYGLFIKHIKECLSTEILDVAMGPILTNYAIEDSFTTDDKAETIDPLTLMPLKEEVTTGMDIDELPDFADDDTFEDSQSDYKDKDDLTIDKVPRRNIIEDIIDEYKKRPLLWDRNLQKDVSGQQRTQLFNEITETVNEKFHTSFSESEIRREISNMRIVYRRAQRKMEKYSTAPRLWYFEKFAFIDKSSDFKTKSTRNKSLDESRQIPIRKRKPKSLRTSQLHEQQITSDIIDQYKKYQFLWNPNLPAYKDIARRNIGYNKIAKFIQKRYKKEVNGEDINRRICSLRSAHRLQTQRKNADYPVTLWYYNKLMFVFDRKSEDVEDIEQDVLEDVEASDQNDELLSIDQSLDKSQEMEDIESEVDASNPPGYAECELNSHNSEEDQHFEDNEDLENNEILLALIEEYRKHPCLWQNDLYQKSSRTFLFEALQTITQELNLQFNKQLTVIEVRKRIMEITNTYKDTLRSKNDFEKDPCNADTKFYTDVDYFDQLWFLGTAEHEIYMHLPKDLSEESEKMNESNEDDTSSGEKPYVGMITKNVELLTCIIKAYKKQPCLWSAEKYTADTFVRRNAYGQMAKDIHEKCGIKFTYVQLTYEIRRLRASYQRMLRGKRENPEYNIKMWYAELLSFIEDNAEGDAEEPSTDDNDNKSIDGEEGETARKRGNSIRTRKIILLLIDLYKSQRVLWDANHPDYVSINARKKAFEEMHSNLPETLDGFLSVEDIRHQIRYLKTVYFRALQNKIAYHKGIISKKPSQPFYYQHLSFLEPFAPKKSAAPKLLDVKLDPTEDFTFLIENKPLMTKFIELYAEQPCLWDQNHVDMDNPSAQSEAYKTLINMFSQNDIFLRKQQVTSAIALLHATVVSTQTAFEDNKNKKEPIWFYEKLKFLGKISQKSSKICLHCNKYFRTMHELEKHKLLIGEHPYRCLVCGEGFMSRAKYQYHMNTHKEPFKCDLCDFQALDKQNFQVHMFRHKGITPFPCDQCEKKFVTSTERSRHMRTHTGEKPFVCEICGKNMASKSEVHLHMKRHLNQRDYKCHVCGNAFFTPKSLRDHITTHSDERKHVCVTCGASFKRKKTLYQHESLHSERKKHECKICGKLFAQKAGLYSHMKSHDLLVVDNGKG